jgi:hypothetical protein
LDTPYLPIAILLVIASSAGLFADGLYGAAPYYKPLGMTNWQRLNFALIGTIDASMNFTGMPHALVNLTL